MSRQNLTVIRGNDETLTINLTGLLESVADIWLTVGALFQKRLGDGIEVVDSDSFTVELDPADTSGAPPVRASYPYDVQIKLDDGDLKTPIRGRFIVLPDVTTEED